MWRDTGARYGNKMPDTKASKREHSLRSQEVIGRSACVRFRLDPLRIRPQCTGCRAAPLGTGVNGGKSPLRPKATQREVKVPSLALGENLVGEVRCVRHRIDAPLKDRGRILATLGVLHCSTQGGQGTGQPVHRIQHLQGMCSPVLKSAVDLCHQRAVGRDRPIPSHCAFHFLIHIRLRDPGGQIRRLPRCYECPLCYLHAPHGNLQCLIVRQCSLKRWKAIVIRHAAPSCLGPLITQSTSSRCTRFAEVMPQPVISDIIVNGPSPHPGRSAMPATSCPQTQSPTYAIKSTSTALDEYRLPATQAFARPGL